eukprot:5631967-Pyramimonas_sp.AAC.1
MSQDFDSSAKGPAPAAPPPKHLRARLFCELRAEALEGTRPDARYRDPAGLGALGTAEIDEELRDEQRSPQLCGTRTPWT